MEMSALVATTTSVLAIGLTIVLLRFVRQDRQRSEARVAALVSLAAQPVPAPAMTFEHPPVKLQPRGAAAPAPAAAPHAAARRAPVRLSAADVEIFRDAAPVVASSASHELFEPQLAATRNSLLYIGVGAIVMAAMIALGFRWALSSPGEPTSGTSATIAPPAAATAQPLALVSLRHEQSADGTLVISGVVKNPAGSIARERIFAAASLLDRDGAMVASARAPLDFTTLAAGEESPFVVRITGAGGVARYRIGFRDADGTAVRHVDKR